MVAYRSGEESDHRVCDRERPGLSPGQYEAAQGYLFRGEVIRYPLIDILVMAAQEREVWLHGVPDGILMAE